MSTTNGPLFVTAQAYPLWVAWYKSARFGAVPRDQVELIAATTDEELEESLQADFPAHPVIAWEYEPDTVPQPLVPNIGRDDGTAYFGTTPEVVVEQVRDAMRRERDKARELLA